MKGSRSNNADMGLCMDQVRDLPGYCSGILLNGQLREYFFKGREFHKRAKIFNGIIGNNAPAMKNHYSIADAFHRIQLVGTEENRLAAGRQFLDEATEDQRGAHVKAGEWLIQQDEFRVVKQGGNEQDLLPHTF